MAVTLRDMAVQSSDPFERGVVKRFAETSELLDVIRVKKISGLRYSYRVQDRLPGIEWRRANEGYSESTGVIVPRYEDLKTFGGRFFIDEVYLRNQRKSGRDAIDIQAEQAEMKAMAAARELERSVLEGDDLVDPDELMGLRRRAVNNQVILAGSGGATISLAMLNSLIAAVSRQLGMIHIFMNKSTLQKVTDLAIASSGTNVVINYDNINQLGARIKTYDGVPLHVVEDDWDTTTILDAEDPGDGTADTYSVYAIATGEMGVQLLVGGGGDGDGPIATITSLGKAQQGPPGEIWQLDSDVGMITPHPRSLARLRGALLS